MAEFFPQVQIPEALMKQSVELMYQKEAANPDLSLTGGLNTIAESILGGLKERQTKQEGLAKEQRGIMIPVTPEMVGIAKRSGVDLTSPSVHRDVWNTIEKTSVQTMKGSTLMARAREFAANKNLTELNSLLKTVQTISMTDPDYLPIRDQIADITTQLGQKRGAGEGITPKQGVQEALPGLSIR